jgi:hypothetical protein
VEKMKRFLDAKLIGAKLKFERGMQYFARKEAGDSHIITVAVVLILAIALLVVFKDKIFTPGKTIIQNSGTSMDNITNGL